jgi:hypothetical protein
MFTGGRVSFYMFQDISENIVCVLSSGVAVEEDRRQEIELGRKLFDGEPKLIE